MTRTAPRQRAAIAVAFGVQAVLIVAALAVPAELASTAGVAASSATAKPIQLEPFMKPAYFGGDPKPGPFTVTVNFGAQSASEPFPAPAGPPMFMLQSGSDAVGTVTFTVPANSPMPSSLQLTESSGPSSEQTLLLWPYPVDPGQHTFALQLGTLAPGSDDVIVMTVSNPGGAPMAGGVIAEVTAS